MELLVQRQEVQEWRNPIWEKIFWGMGVDFLPQQLYHSAGHLMANFLGVFGVEYFFYPLETKLPAVCGSEWIEVAHCGEDQS